MMSDNLVIENGTIYTPSKIINNGLLLLQNEKIAYVGDKNNTSLPKNYNRINAEGQIVCPGFVDLQSNGGGGVFLTEDGTYIGVCKMAKAHAKFGTTSFTPTILTADINKMCTALNAIAQAVVKGTGGAIVLGSHLEGPFINPKKRGVHPAEFITEPSKELFEKFYSASEATLKIFTLAPELEGSLDLIEYIKKYDIFVSMGHTTATYQQISKAINSGLSLATHIFNGMVGLGSREPGPVGTILSNNKLKTGLIADGIHVHPISMKIVINAKGYENVFLVTDSMPPIGTNLDSFEIYGQKILVKEGKCYTEDGTIAGSTLTMNKAVKIVHEKVGVPLKEAIRMATEIPAKAIGVFDVLGSLTVGKEANVVICDKSMEIQKVIVKGKIVYNLSEQENK